MFRRKDIIVIAVALLVALAAYGGMLVSRSGQSISGEVAVYVNGALFATASLADELSIDVMQENGDTNIVRIGGGGVKMVHSSCKNQLCLSQGEVTADNWTRRAMGRSIICLPNRIVVELVLEDSGHRIAEEDLADV